MLSDLRYACRTLAKAPAFAAAGVITLALGIGATASIFRFVEAVLLRPLPYPASEQLVAVWQTLPTDSRQGASPANFLDWQSSSRSFTAMAAYQADRKTLAARAEPTVLGVATVSPDFFRVLGTDAVRGRLFGRSQSSGTREAVLGYELWHSQFGHDERIIGRTLLIDREPVEVVGITAPRFQFPDDVSVWVLANDEVPALPVPYEGNLRELRDARYLGVIARLGPQGSIENSQSEMDVLAARLSRQYPDANAKTGIRVVSLHDDLVGDTRPQLLIMSGVVGFVLLIACVNVTNLLLARAVRRTRELAIRSALGAGRARLVRQLLSESLVLGAAGCGAGLLLERLARPYVAAVLPDRTARLAAAATDWQVFAFAAVASVGSALLVILVPAMRATRRGFGDALKGNTHSTLGVGGTRVRGLLASVEIGLSFVLVVGAALLLQTVWRLERVDPGFQSDQILTAALSFPGADVANPREPRAFYEHVIERVSGLPGVDAVGATETLPLRGRSYRANVSVRGRSFESGEAPDVCWRIVTSDYLQTLRVPLLRGRMFQSSDREGSDPVSLVNATLARLLWPHDNPIGRQIRTGLDGGPDTWTTIVGVVGDTPQDGLGAPVQPEMYRPLGQPSRYSGESMKLVVRAAGDPTSIVPAIRAAVADIDARVPVSDVQTLDDLRHRSMATPVNIGTLIGTFAALALILALIGLYGVMSCLVSERTREFGIRLAIGATPGELLRLVLARSLVHVFVGLAIGIGAALILSRGLSSLLFGLSATDPTTFTIVALALGAVGIVASYIPARRAARVDPVVTLRTDY